MTTRWFKVPFSSPSWRSLNPLKGSLNHPKKVMAWITRKFKFSCPLPVLLKAPHLSGVWPLLLAAGAALAGCGWRIKWCWLHQCWQWRCWNWMVRREDPGGRRPGNAEFGNWFLMIRGKNTFQWTLSLLRWFVHWDFLFNEVKSKS